MDNERRFVITTNVCSNSVNVDKMVKIDRSQTPQPITIKLCTIDLCHLFSENGNIDNAFYITAI